MQTRLVTFPASRLDGAGARLDVEEKGPILAS
jgi:hypothetical protein